jgi:hypothetical protein
VADLDTATARAWIDRWDTQQTNYLPDREDRFTALIDAVEAGAGRSDPLVLDLVNPTLARLGRALIEREEQRRFPDGQPETWNGWWEAATADPALAGPAAERERRGLSENHHGSESVLLGTHADALGAAGFTEIGTIWQRGDSRILCAVLG